MDGVKKYRVGLGVTGGIAAYKAVEVLRLLQKSGCDVRVAMTKHATEFVQPLTFRALSEFEVLVDDYAPEIPDPIAHINFSQNIDLLLIVPATANVIAKFANGIADDFLSSTYLASSAPVLIAPAMNTLMWENAATQRNIEQLKKDGVQFVEPVSGELACKTVGTGKLEDVENIAAQALNLLNSKLKIPNTKFNDLLEEKILLTVGGTREAIDPIRFISNHSSGKMGFALALAAAERGAKVTVVAGAVSVEPPENIKVISAISAEEMRRAVMNELKDASIFVGAAAVADYRPVKKAPTKLKKTEAVLDLQLEKTPDILAEVSKNRHSGLLVIGFAAETEDVLNYARSKMEKKNLDLVIANDITKKGAGFDADTNIATILRRGEDGKIELPLMPKREMADKILDEVVRLRKILPKISAA